MKLYDWHGTQRADIPDSQVSKLFSLKKGQWGVNPITLKGDAYLVRFNEVGSIKLESSVGLFDNLVIYIHNGDYLTN
jgi:hypothetical protein